MGLPLGDELQVWGCHWGWMNGAMPPIIIIHSQLAAADAERARLLRDVQQMQEMVQGELDRQSPTASADGGSEDEMPGAFEFERFMGGMASRGARADAREDHARLPGNRLIFWPSIARHVGKPHSWAGYSHDVPKALWCPDKPLIIETSPYHRPVIYFCSYARQA